MQSINTKPKLLILEDDFGRRKEMDRLVSSEFDLRFCGSVTDFNQALFGVERLAVISLDRDLFPNGIKPSRESEKQEAIKTLGTGEQACQIIIDRFQDEVFPNIVIHTNNVSGRFRMLKILGIKVQDDIPVDGKLISSNKKIQVSVVQPYNGLSWISKNWAPTVIDLKK